MKDYFTNYNEMPSDSEMYDLFKKIYMDNNLNNNNLQCNKDSIFKDINEYSKNEDSNYCPNSNIKSLYNPTNNSFNYQKFNDKNIISTLKNCSLICHEMIDKLINENYNDRKQQIKLLHDCANICDNQALCFIKKSDFCKEHANLCGKICLACSQECNKYHDTFSQHTAKICNDCGKICINYSRIY